MDMPAAAPVSTDQTDAETDSGSDAANSSTVLLTVMDNHDGTFTLLKGDENDGDQAEGSGAADAVGATGGNGSPPAADAAASQGQTFDSPGALLKGILDIVKEAEGSGAGSAQANFSAGFDGGSSASPSKTPAAQQKY